MNEPTTTTLAPPRIVRRDAMLMSGLSERYNFSNAGMVSQWERFERHLGHIPGQVGNVSASAGYASATVTWSAPTSGDPVTSYTITPYIGSAAQTPTKITGNPAPTSVLVSGLTNGTTYTFTVTPSNPADTGPESAQSSAVTPLASTGVGKPTVTNCCPAFLASGDHAVERSP